jgi:hypothetical protein
MDEENGRTLDPGGWGPDRAVASEVETRELVLVDDPHLLDAREFVQACESCVDTAFLTFDYLLEAVMEGDPATDYLMLRAASCPSCGSHIYEKTRIVPCPEA